MEEARTDPQRAARAFAALTGTEKGTDDEDLWREAGWILIGDAFVKLGLIFNRVDVLEKEYRAVHTK